MINPPHGSRGRIGDTLFAQIPESFITIPDNHPILFQWLSTLWLLAVFIVVDYFFSRSGHLPTEAYSQQSL